jgi:hypothetical protein
VVDEAQGLSAMECRAIGRRCATGSATVLGDIAQGTTAWAPASWQELLFHLGKPAAWRRELTAGYRVPRQILDFASQLLPLIAPGLTPASSVRQDPGSLAITAGALRLESRSRKPRPRAEPAGLGRGDRGRRPDRRAARRAVRRRGAARGAGRGSRAAHAGAVTLPRVWFDQVIVVEPADRGRRGRGLHRLYVALTRAVSG